MLQGERVEEARELGVGAELHLEDLHGRERVGPVDVRARHVEAAGLRGGREAVEARFAVEHGLEPPVLVREQRRRAAGQQLLERVEERFVRVGVVRDVAAQDDVDAARRGLEEVAPPVLVHRDVAGVPPVHQSVAPREFELGMPRALAEQLRWRLTVSLLAVGCLQEGETTDLAQRSSTMKESSAHSKNKYAYW